MNIGICTSEVGFISLNISKFIYSNNIKTRCIIFCFIKNLNSSRKKYFINIDNSFKEKNRIIFLPTYYLKPFGYLINFINFYLNNLVLYLPYPNAFGLKNHFFKKAKIIYYGDGLSFYRDNEPYWLTNNTSKKNDKNYKNKTVITTFLDVELKNINFNYININNTITRNFLLNITKSFQKKFIQELNSKLISNKNINFIVSTKFNNDNLKISRMSAKNEFNLFKKTLLKINKLNHINIIKIHPQSSNKFKLILNNNLKKFDLKKNIIINNYIPSEFYILYLIHFLKLNKSNIKMYTASHGGITSAIIGEIDNIEILYNNLISYEDFINKKWYDKRVSQEEEIKNFLNKNINSKS